MSATPFTAVFLMQYVYCGDPWQISASAFLANAICVGVLYYLLCALIRKPAAASVMIHTACALLGAINYFVCAEGWPADDELFALQPAAVVANTAARTKIISFFILVPLFRRSLSRDFLFDSSIIAGSGQTSQEKM